MNEEDKQELCEALQYRISQELNSLSLDIWDKSPQWCGTQLENTRRRVDLLDRFEDVGPTRDNLSRPKKLVRNRIKCLKCGDIIESKSVHDYVKCSCGACATDGGLEYMHINGNNGDWENLSEWEEENE